MEQQRPVHHRVVPVSTSDVVLPREVGMQALVVMQRARPEVPEACNRGNDHEEGIQQNLYRHSALQPCVQAGNERASAMHGAAGSFPRPRNGHRPRRRLVQPPPPWHW